jgi:hypothetical protein
MIVLSCITQQSGTGIFWKADATKNMVQIGIPHPVCAHVACRRLGRPTQYTELRRLFKVDLHNTL